MVPAHAEMSFAPRPPARLYFYSHVSNTGIGGETPVSDLRAVAQALTPAARRRLSRPLRFERVYYDERSWFGALDPDEDQVVAEHVPRSLGSRRLRWLPGKRATSPRGCATGRLKLAHVVGSPFRAHPSDNVGRWHSHLTNLHVTTAWAAELRQGRAALTVAVVVLRSLFFSALYGGLALSSCQAGQSCDFVFTGWTP